MGKWSERSLLSGSVKHIMELPLNLPQVLKLATRSKTQPYLITLKDKAPVAWMNFIFHSSLVDKCFKQTRVSEVTGYISLLNYVLVTRYLKIVRSECLSGEAEGFSDSIYLCYVYPFNKLF